MAETTQIHPDKVRAYLATDASSVLAIGFISLCMLEGFN